MVLAGSGLSLDAWRGLTLKESLSTLRRKAVIIWKPEPFYTEEARRNNLSGLVRLKLLLSASGRVMDMLVEKDLRGGLTQQAQEAARYISFIPAEKDGRPASQWVTVEYNFNIY